MFPNICKSCYRLYIFFASLSRNQADEDISERPLTYYSMLKFVLCVSVVVGTEVEEEEDVFQEEVGSCLLSPLHPETMELPDTPVSLH